MAKAKQLPSGNWRVQVSTGIKNEKGKYIYESITKPTEKEALYAALEYELKRKKEKYSPQKMTLREACKQYINNKSAILSPSTITGYNKLAKNRLQGIMDLPLDKLTSENIQMAVNIDSKNHSPKSVRNAHGFLSAVLRDYYSDFALRTALPQKQKYIPYIPGHDEIESILKAAKGEKIEVPILLALWLGLRMSEIRGLKWDCVNFKKSTITIKEVIVDAKGGPAKKQTKTYSGTRVLQASKYILDCIEKLPHDGDYIINYSGQTIYKRFVKMLKNNNLHHMRFHDLRHANASIMLGLKIPDKYAMKRLGHSTPDMLKRVYQHTMSREEEETNKLISDYFEKLT